ncbi:hypothetical protein N2152v2_002286 [Parachlorella kessleri]
MQAARLLAEAFGDSNNYQPSLPGQLLYQLRLTAVLLWQALLLRDRFTTLLVSNSSSAAAAADSRAEAASRGSCRGHSLHSMPAAVVCLTPNRGAQAIPRPWPSELLTLRTCVVSNMAVQAAVRRRGIGKALLAACEGAALQQGAYDVIALLVHEYNEPAVRLYQSSGYSVVPEWVDPEWLERAENGKLGPMRRVLMVKPLSLCESSSRSSRVTGMDSTAGLTDAPGGAATAAIEVTASKGDNFIGASDP